VVQLPSLDKSDYSEEHKTLCDQNEIKPAKDEIDKLELGVKG